MTTIVMTKKTIVNLFYITFSKPASEHNYNCTEKPKEYET